MLIHNYNNKCDKEFYFITNINAAHKGNNVQLHIYTGYIAINM